MLTLADRLKHARAIKKWSQADLAVAAGVSQGTIGNIESGARQSKGSIPQIAEALGIDYKWLAYGTGSALTLPTQNAGTTVPTLPGPSPVPAPGDVGASPVNLAVALAVVASSLNQLPDDRRELVAQCLQTLARAPDSARAMESLLSAMRPAAGPPPAESRDFQPPVPSSLFVKNKTPS